MTDNHSSVSGQVASRKNGQRFDRCIEGLFANSDHHHHHQHHRHQHHDDHHQNNHHNHHNHHTSYQWFLIDLPFLSGFLSRDWPWGSCKDGRYGVWDDGIMSVDGSELWR